MQNQEPKKPGKAARVVAGGRSILNWWTGGREPVAQKVAEARAQVCVGCPLNQDATMFEELTGIAATLAKAAFEIKSKRFLKTSNEHLLGVCEACGCDLKLKTWTPMKHIKDHAIAEDTKKMPEFCWIKTEQQ